MAELACVGCGKALARRVFRGFPVEGCPGCGGVWLQESMVEALLFTAESRSPGFEAGRLRGENLELLIARPCPACGAGMKRLSVGPGRIAVDRCPEHGVWLDRGELEGLESTAQGNPPSAPGQAPPRRRWTCPSCGERMEFEFTHCWKCQADAPQEVRSIVGPPPPPPLRQPAPPSRSTILGWMGWVLALGIPVAGLIGLGAYSMQRRLGGWGWKAVWIFAFWGFFALVALIFRTGLSLRDHPGLADALGVIFRLSGAGRRGPRR